MVNLTTREAQVLKNHRAFLGAKGFRALAIELDLSVTRVRHIHNQLKVKLAKV